MFGEESIRVHTSRHSVVVGDLIRVTGGPTCKGVPICQRGVFRVEGFVFDPRFKGRTWLDCSRLELPGAVRRLFARRDWSLLIPCGRFLLYVTGPKYRRNDFPGVYWQPFTVKKMKT
jgi:hypothetical protein